MYAALFPLRAVVDFFVPAATRTRSAETWRGAVARRRGAEPFCLLFPWPVVPSVMLLAEMIKCRFVRVPSHPR